MPYAYDTVICDDLPAVPGLAECFGTSVHHCPYCDGRETRDRLLVVIGQRTTAAGLALALKTGAGSVALNKALQARAGVAVEKDG